jgi:hypothetical protein
METAHGLKRVRQLPDNSSNILDKAAGIARGDNICESDHERVSTISFSFFPNLDSLSVSSAFTGLIEQI